MLMATARHGGGGGWGGGPASPAADGDCDGDEAFARALQREEEQARLMALAGVVPGGDGGEGGDDGADPDADATAGMSYEQLTALGDAVGAVGRGASDAARAGVSVAAYGGREGDPCIVCQHDLLPGAPAATLPCGHAYHGPCIDGWLARSKACPLCGVEVE
jgi:E3 ubiquitin-protein ligase BIG BROTHER-like protein